VTSNGLRNQGPLDASACRANNHLPHKQGSRRGSTQIQRGPPRRASAAGGGPLGKATAASNRVPMGMKSATAKFRTAERKRPGAERATPSTTLLASLGKTLIVQRSRPSASALALGKNDPTFRLGCSPRPWMYWHGRAAMRSVAFAPAFSVMSLFGRQTLSRHMEAA